jgi:hypothetical protein
VLAENISSHKFIFLYVHYILFLPGLTTDSAPGTAYVVRLSFGVDVAQSLVPGGLVLVVLFQTQAQLAGIPEISSFLGLVLS